MVKTKVYLIRTWCLKFGRILWIVCDPEGERLARARTESDALAAWIEEHGSIDTLQRFKGKMSPSEASMTIASLRIKAKQLAAPAGGAR